MKLIPVQNAYKSWSKAEEELLSYGIREGASLKIMCAALRRAPGGIIQRARRLKLLTSDKAGNIYVIEGEKNRLWTTEAEKAALAKLTDPSTINWFRRAWRLRCRREQELRARNGTETN